MAEWITVQGTKSSAGKSLVTTKIIEILKEKHSVTPFKPVNFSRNSYPVENSEIGYSTLHQARKAGVEPEKKMAPVLVKPMKEKTELIADSGVEETSYEDLDEKLGGNTVTSQNVSRNWTENTITWSGKDSEA